MAKSVRKSIYREDWFDDIENNVIECNKQDLQKIKAIQKKEYKNKREKQRKRNGEFY